jgi:V/A-type H+-transporting ATPase subunit A
VEARNERTSARGHIREINGPILRIHLPGGRNGEQVRIGSLDIVGEIIALEGRCDRPGLRIDRGAETRRGRRGARSPADRRTRPGMLQGIFDGVQRPLQRSPHLSGDNIPRGLRIDSLDRSRAWPFALNDAETRVSQVGPGTRLGTVQETDTIEHRILVPPTISGELIDLAPDGDYTLEQTIARVRDAHRHGAQARCTTAGRCASHVPIGVAITASNP